MLLSEISSIIDCVKILNLTKNKHFSKISTSSKNCNNKTIFVVNSKKKIKERFFVEALKKKIPAIITNKIYHNLSVTQFFVKDIEKEKNKLLNKLKPYKPLNSIAITGTNGKTSVAWYISQICKTNNVKIKMQGTLGYYINGTRFKYESLTTPVYETLHQNSFSKFNNNYNFVFEASSHALDQDRINKFPINIAAITNISHDHLDYHKSIYNYKKSKFKLFNKFLDRDGLAVINSRLLYYDDLVDCLKMNKIKFISYGKKNIFFSKKRKIILLNIYNQKFNLNKIQISKIDIENLECAIACCLQLNITPKNIFKSLKKLKSPPGRSQVINFKKKLSKIIIDYAHTPEALKNILEAYSINKKRPSLVFGCGGNRDKLKRKLMGKIAYNLADQVYVTDDNPRNENPRVIRSEIIKFCPKAIEVSSRKKAIYKAIQNLKRKSFLIIAGKGHENIQILKNKIIKFDDVKITNNFIKNFK